MSHLKISLKVKSNALVIRQFRKTYYTLQQGVTLIELILVLAILGIILASAYPMGSNFLARNRLVSEVDEITNSLRIAQINSMSGKADDNWGVYISAAEVVIFKGGNYVSRDTTYDQIHKIANNISVTSTPGEIVFDKLNGDPGSVASITVSDLIGDSTNISVNEIGTVDVN